MRFLLTDLLALLVKFVIEVDSDRSCNGSGVYDGSGFYVLTVGSPQADGALSARRR